MPAVRSASFLPLAEMFVSAAGVTHIRKGRGSDRLPVLIESGDRPSPTRGKHIDASREAIDAAAAGYASFPSKAH